MFVAKDFSNRSQPWGKKVQNIIFYKVLPYVHSYAECLAHPNMAIQIPQQTFSRWKAHWEQFGEPPYVTSKRRGLTRAHVKRITAQELQALKTKLDNNKYMWLDEMQRFLYDEFGKWICHGTIWDAIRKRLKYSKKTWNDIAAKQNQQRRLEFLQV